MEPPPAAHRVPAEIITDFVVRLRNDSQSGGILNEGDLSPLQTCSLVCRHWAKISRPSLFYAVVIRSETHLNRLLQFLSTPSLALPSLADCIQRVSIDDSGRQQKPWIHRVPCIQPYISSKARWSTILVRHDASECLTSLYGRIPRTLPGNTLRFRIMMFTDIRFRRVHNLLRIVQDLPNLHHLTCQRISFDDGTIPEEEAMHILRRSANGYPIHLDLEGLSGLGADHRRFYLALCSIYLRRDVQLDTHLWRTFRQIFTQVFPVIKDASEANGSYFTVLSNQINCNTKVLSLSLGHRHLTVSYRASGSFPAPVHNWDSCETVLLGRHPPHSILLRFHNEAVFKSMLDAIIDGRLLRRLHTIGKVDIWYYAIDEDKSRYKARCKLADILALPAGHNIDGHHIALKASQRYELMRLKSEDERLEYLRGLVPVEQAASNLDSEAEANIIEVV